MRGKAARTSVAKERQVAQGGVGGPEPEPQEEAPAPQTAVSRNDGQSRQVKCCFIKITNTEANKVAIDSQADTDRRWIADGRDQILRGPGLRKGTVLDVGNEVDIGETQFYADNSRVGWGELRAHAHGRSPAAALSST